MALVTGRLIALRFGEDGRRVDDRVRAVQILLGHSKIEITVDYLVIDVEDALALAENTEI
ncbi:hypothetical protein YGS_C1P2744 [Sphingobium sp. YG1]|nr:hypothetical protein YGS_C1P2744 [Sphingobium sp. YG1]